jgi:tetratricopeptide (TPR) repeat protein
MFRLGKLYDNQEQQERAIEWYGRAVDRSMQPDADLPTAYVLWASRFLGERAHDRGDLAGAEKYYSRIADGGGGDMADLDRLAVVRIRLGKFEDAALAWRLAERLNPAQADRARYCGALARAAATLKTLPENGPDGRAWGDLTQGELEAMMAEKATASRDSIAAVQNGERTLTGEERAALSAELAGAHSIFVAAGLEYALRNLDIRQAAFSGGYAPMVFHAKRWLLR